ncbi:hypothetical protein C6503_22655 [Candidatus Poribacteria bacterium]|nr:MAG: hypothetical protein C6503_22655 [Candidatus Poribacteria bacterium]
MIITHKLRFISSIIRRLILVILFFMMGAQIGFTGEDGMKKGDFQVSVDAQRIEFTKLPIFKDGAWLVPLEPFAEQLGLKIEYPKGAKMVVLCGGVASELCVPLQFQNSEEGVVDIDGVTYVQPAHLAKTFGFEIYKASANTLEVIQPTRLASEFTLPDLEGNPRHLKEFRGKKTFLYVWGSW